MKHSQHNLGYFVGTSARLMRNAMHHRMKENGYDLTIEQLFIIKILHRSDGLSQQVLADYFSKDKGSITRIINTMEDGNLVVRIPDKIDKRSKLIYLTPFGKKLHQEIHKIILDFNESLTSEISKDDLNQCVTVLEKIIDKLCNHDVACATKIGNISNV